MAYRAYAHVWTADYRYWNPVAPERETEAQARADIVASADKFWPDDKNPPRRASFLSHCIVIGPGESLPRA